MEEQQRHECTASVFLHCVLYIPDRQALTGGENLTRLKGHPEETHARSGEFRAEDAVLQNGHADPTLLPPAETDEEYDPYLLPQDTQDTPQEEEAISALLWPEKQTRLPEKLSSGPRRMSREAFTKALARVVTPPPVFSFDAVRQKTVIRLDASERTIVNAPPGTGKTYALIQRIFYLLLKGAGPENIVVICISFSQKRRLLSLLKAEGEKKGMQDVSEKVRILTYEDFAKELLTGTHEENIRISVDNPDLLKKAGALLATSAGPLSPLQHLFADDVQNIVGPQAAFLLQLTAHLPSGAGFTYFGDRCEAIFDVPANKANYSMSDQLYGQLLHTYRDAKRLTMSKNYRSTPELTSLSEPYRQAILSGHAEEVEQAASEVLHRVRSQDIPWQDLWPSAFRAWTRNETLGILTRTSGEALAVSGLLYGAGIAHTLHISHQEEQYGAWLGRVLLAHRKDTISRAEFVQTFRRLYPKADPGPYWDGLRSGQADPAARRFAVADLLSALQDPEKHAQLLPSPDEKPAPVTVSTIHMAGGLEFDTVFLASDLLSGGYTQRARKEAAKRTDAQVLAESRQVYVALTRARRRLFLMMLPLEAVRLSKIRSRRPHGPERWYKSQIKRVPAPMLKSYRKRSLRAFEIGIAADLLPETFADSEEIQFYLQDTGSELPNAELELRLEKTAPYPSYELIDPDVPSLRLAQTDRDFVTELTSALGYARNLQKNSIRNEHYPETFREIYVRRVVTHIGPAAEAPVNARIYGDFCIWLGLEVVGFARAVEAQT